MNIDLEIQVATDASPIPHPSQIKTWVAVGLAIETKNIEFVIRIVNEQEIQKLNHQFRGINKPTNVLSFAFDSPKDVDIGHLGDIIICASVVAEEAKTQNKDLLAHWAHIIIHGILHLKKYDHKEEHQAIEMESLEVEMLHALGFNSPY